MPEKQRKFGKKTIVAVLFILLFTLSLAVVFFYPTPGQQKVGYVTVQRTEGYWENRIGNATEVRYLINYGTYGMSDTPRVMIHDKADPGMTQILVTQTTSNVESITYDKNTGDITVVVTNIKAQDKILAQLAFVTDPVDIFASGAFPTTTVTPDKIYWGDKASVSIDVSAFTVAKTTNMTYVGVYIYPSSTVTEISDVKISPVDGKSEPPLYQSIWEYPNTKVASYGAHEANYTVTIPSTPVSQDIVLATWVEVRYSEPLRMKALGSIEGAEGTFFTWDSSISYEYEKGILSRLS